MNLPTLTHEEEVNLERFANLMIELIERHADAVDKNEMLEKLNKINDARDNNLASFLVKIMKKRLYSKIIESYHMYERFVAVPKIDFYERRYYE